MPSTGGSPRDGSPCPTSSCSGASAGQERALPGTPVLRPHSAAHPVYTVHSSSAVSIPSKGPAAASVNITLKKKQRKRCLSLSRPHCAEQLHIRMEQEAPRLAGLLPWHRWGGVIAQGPSGQGPRRPDAQLQRSCSEGTDSHTPRPAALVGPRAAINRRPSRQGGVALSPGTREAT